MNYKCGWCGWDGKRVEEQRIEYIDIAGVVVVRFLCWLCGLDVWPAGQKPPWEKDEDEKDE